MNPKKKNACVLMLRAKILIWEKIVSLWDSAVCDSSSWNQAFADRDMFFSNSLNHVVITQSKRLIPVR